MKVKKEKSLPPVFVLSTPVADQAQRQDIPPNVAVVVRHFL